MNGSFTGNNKGMTLIEAIVVTAIFAVMAVVINGVIFSAQSIWATSFPYSTLEEEALVLSRQLNIDISRSAARWAPEEAGLGITDPMPHVSVETGDILTNGDEWGSEVLLLAPAFNASNRPILSGVGEGMTIDWKIGSIVRYYQEGTQLIREVTQITDGTVTEQVLTNHLVSIRFFDADSAPLTIDSYFLLRYEIMLQKRIFTGRLVQVSRNGTAFLRNSQGSGDLENLD